MTPENSSSSLAARVTLVSAIILIAIDAIALLGESLNEPLLSSFGQELPTIKANAAVDINFSGISLSGT